MSVKSETRPSFGATDVLTPEAETAIIARALHRVGYDDNANNGHMTYRQPDGSFLTIPDGVGWDEVRASDIIRIDESGKMLSGEHRYRPSLILHLEFHKARPNCNVTVHNHPKFATIWSAAGVIPASFDQRAALVPDEECVLYDDFTANVRVTEAAKAAVRAIGGANYALLRNHGVFVVGDSIAQAYTRASALEWRCRQAWFAHAIGATHAIPEVGKEAIARFVESVGGEIPDLWEWAVRRETGPVLPVLS